MPGSPLLAARLSYQRTAVKGIDMAQSGRGSIGPGRGRPPPPEAGHGRPKAAKERERA